MPNYDGGMSNAILLPATVRQNLDIGGGLKNAFLVTNRLEFTPARPGERREGLRMAPAKHPMRLEGSGREQPGDAAEKGIRSFNRLAGFDFVDSLDHGFIPEPGLRSSLSLT